VRTFVFVGLGNPGKQYEVTRHNLGALVVKAAAHQWGMRFKTEARFHAEIARGIVEGNTVYLVLPLTYMNESGRAVKKIVDYYKLDAAGVFIVCDDVALPYGAMRLKPSGSNGGHNGLRSIEAELGTELYPRLRMGIGSAEEGRNLADFVLQNFTAAEISELPAFINKGAAVLKDLMHSPITLVMNRANASKKEQEPPKKGLGEQKHESKTESI
jgi:PTH1 family peptidyl-tRNA hydrolase